MTAECDAARDAEREVVAIDLVQPPTAVDALFELLDERERVHAAARRGDDARRRYVVAHGALRTLLARRLGDEPAALRYRTVCAVCGSREHGRPELDGAGELSFSLSHSHDVAVVAVAPEPVGVDVEVVRERRYLDGVARRIMDDAAFATWSRLADPGDQLVEFLATWTAKEAVSKRRGVGLARPLRDVDTTATTTWRDWPPGCITSVSPAAPGDWPRTTFAAISPL
jgi:4'-phosphopantetheinyl transferase